MNEIMYQSVKRLAESINLSQDIIKVDLGLGVDPYSLGSQQYVITAYGYLGAPKFITPNLESVHFFLMGVKEVVRNIQQTPTEVPSESQQSLY